MMEATEPVVDLAARFSSSDATPTPWGRGAYATSAG
jgi:hypothetical protein